MHAKNQPKRQGLTQKPLRPSFVILQVQQNIHT